MTAATPGVEPPERSVELRTGTVADLDRVLALNHEAVPAVNDIDRAELVDLVAGSERFLVAADDDVIVGFIIVLPPGIAYDSLNYRWFSERFDAFWYVDRVVVAPSAKGRGVGAAIYDRVFADAAGAAPRICAEVNLVPRNEPSLRFHERFGFTSVGTQLTEGGTKEVTLLAADLPESPTAAASPAPAESEAPADDIGRLETDVATVARLLDGLGELAPGERTALLDGLEASMEPDPAQA